jgi:hypothetical protein
MKANPGGQISAEEVVGRDKLISTLWRRLEKQSLTLTGERRMGKTSIIKKMANENRKNIVGIYRDLESVHSLIEFVEIVAQDAEQYLSKTSFLAKKFKDSLKSLTGAEFSGFKFPNAAAPHWKVLLTALIGDVVEHQEKQKIDLIIFFWDEVPLMLQNIMKKEKTDPVELLDTLRSLRMRYDCLRMVYTGSIGLHNVIGSLKKAGNPNDPTNDMFQVEVPPLAVEDAKLLAELLLRGEGLKTKDIPKAALAIATCIDGKPFYIQHLVDRLVNLNREIVLEDIETVLAECISDPQDAWHFNHYIDRIKIYYDASEKALALQILDILSTSKSELDFKGLLNLLKSTKTDEDRELIQEVLTLLARDHYIRFDEKTGYHFYFPLTQRVWRARRGLCQ